MSGRNCQSRAAGTTVKAILLSSVDVPCAVKGSADPLPVKLRIIANGRLPHEVCARLKGGIVTASVYGDLSSERVYFRLEKLTQVRPDGHYVEAQVAGYVSGEDGKYGLRRTVVDKSALLIENALISGFLSGVSEFFEAAALAKLYPNAIVEGPYGNLSSASWGQTALRGLPGNSFKQLAKTLHRLRTKGLEATVQVEPRLFSKYGITTVPTFVTEAGELFEKLVGNVLLVFVLDKIVNETAQRLRMLF